MDASIYRISASEFKKPKLNLLKPQNLLTIFATAKNKVIFSR